MGTPLTPLLELKGVSLKYKTFSLTNINLHIKRGEIVSIIGPNGAGKSTIFRIIIGLESRFKGEVLFNRKDITKLRTYKRVELGIGYIPQESVLIEELTVKDHIYSLLRMRKSKGCGEERLKQLLEWLGLERQFSQKAKELSGGEKKKVELLRVLLFNPTLILCDEPFTSIDPKTVKELLSFFYKIKVEGTSLLLTDHQPTVLDISDRVYLIVGGEILREGSSQELKEDPVVKRFYLG